MITISTTPPEPDADSRCRRTSKPIRLATTDALTLLTGMVPFGVEVGVTASARPGAPAPVNPVRRHRCCSIGPVLPPGPPLESAGTACLLGLLVPRLANRRR